MDFTAEGDAVSVPDQTRLFMPGDETSAFLVVTQGAVRVEQTNKVGRTVVLYRVTPGDSCLLTTTCLLSGTPYAGYGYAEGDVTAIAIPPGAFRRLIREDAQFMELVLGGFATRVAALTDVIDDLLEHRIDRRLARWLAQAPRDVVHAMQHDLAQELGTAREVVSRTLKGFETKGWIAAGRGRIEIVDRAALLRHGKEDAM